MFTRHESQNIKNTLIIMAIILVFLLETGLARSKPSKQRSAKSQARSTQRS